MIERRRTISPRLGLLLLGALACSESPTTPPPEGPVGPSTPGYTLDFRQGSTHTVVPGEVLALDLRITREDGFEAPITFSATASPGIVVIFRPETVIHRDDSDLLVVADQSTQRRTHQVEFIGKSEGRPDQGVTLTLVVVDEK